MLIYHFRPVTPNIGNDVSVFALQALVRDAGSCPRDVVELPARGTSAAIKRGGLTPQNVHEINQLGAGALIGPGNLFENNALEVNRAALASLRVPRLICGVSWGRIFDDDGRLVPRTDSMPTESVIALCEGASAVLVRDAVTRDFLTSLGVATAQVAACPVLTLDPSRLHLPPPDRRADGAALVSVRNPQLMNVSPRLQARVAEDVRRIVDGLRSMGHNQVALVCHDPRDLRFAAGFPDVPTLYTEDPLRFLSWLRDCAVSVTFRLHSFLPCALLGTPAVHLSYDQRAMALIETAGLQDGDVDYVRSADPVAEALCLARDPSVLAATMSRARASWGTFRDTMLDAVRSWLRETDAS